MDSLIDFLNDNSGSHSVLPQILIILFLLYALIRFCIHIFPKGYRLIETYRKKRNALSARHRTITQFPVKIIELTDKLDKLSTSVESFIDCSNQKDDELAQKIDVLFEKQEEIRRRQDEDKADIIRENILNFAERLRNTPDGEFSIEKFNQIFTLGSKYKKIIQENNLTNDVFIHDYEYIEMQYKKRFNKNA